jgi:broad specificity phosphatase PhoE
MRLVAVRHGQASFGSDDYDRLSQRGWEQMQRLGEWLAGHRERFGRVVCGDMRRHRESFEAVARAYQAQGLALPEPETDADFNEFDHRAVINGFVAANANHPSVLAYSTGATDQRAVFGLLRAAFACWARGELDACGEPWSGFRARTRGAGERLHARLDDGSTLLLSSGGVIAQLAAAALDAPDARAVELNLSLRNSALSEFHGVEDGLRLGSWNAVPHLAATRELWTYY